MAIKSSLRNMVVVLMLVCLGASAAVAVVYAITKDPIAAANLAKTNKAIEEVVPSFDNNPSEEILYVAADASKPSETNKVYVAKKDGGIVGYAVESTTTKGFGGAFTIMVGFEPDGKVYNTSVISHAETPGLGAKITDRQSGFITQWRGKNLTNGSVILSVKKDGGDFDAITASTITSRAFCDAMETAANVFYNINPENN